MRPVVAPLLGVVLTLSLRAAWGAASCPPPSIAGSPNSLTTSRPEPDVEAAAAKCTKPVVTATKPAVTSPAAVSASAPPEVAPSWKSVLDPLSVGGWAFLSDGPAENPSALYASTHNMLHNGNVVTAWMRWEFSLPQAEVYPLHYLSAVTREELDCDERTFRRSAVVYYLGNNLQQKGPSFTALNDDTTWKAAIPGSEADAMLNWGCPKAKPEKVARPDKADKADKADAIEPADKPQKPAKAAKTAAAATAAATPAAPSSGPGPVPLTGPTEVHTAK